jgi:pimeloyl-ACP methyl ester carboxylesterase
LTVWLKLAAGAAFVASGTLVGIQAIRAARVELASFRPRRGPVERPAVLAGLDRLGDVSFSTSTGVVIRGWYISSRNGAVVVLTHGSNSDRAQLATEARILADADFGALAFDWPGHGESDGRVTFGRGEEDALRAAVSFVASQPDVRLGGIGALGFSIGAALVAVTAAGDDRLRALALVSTFADSEELTGVQFARWGPITQWPALWVDRSFMTDGPLRPVDAVASLQGRPLMVIAGTDDTIVPAWMSERVYAAANARKEFLLIPGSGHGCFDALASGPYSERIVRFFKDALVPDSG